MVYDTNFNYIGSSPAHKKLTHQIFVRHKKLNFLAYIHDKLYELAFEFRSKILFILFKFFADLIWLIVGIPYMLLDYRVHKSLKEVALVIFGYIIITVYSPWYIYNHFRKNGN